MDEDVPEVIYYRPKGSQDGAPYVAVICYMGFFEVVADWDIRERNEEIKHILKSRRLQGKAAMQKYEELGRKPLTPEERGKK